MIIFVTGGVRSGKSTYAEKRALALNEAKDHSRLYYIATSNIYDQEMVERVERHQIERCKSGANWHVLEQTKNLDELFHLFRFEDVLLLDCVTTLLSNELFVFSNKNIKMWRNVHFQLEVEMKLKKLFTELATASLNVVIVSNEVAYDLQTKDQDVTLYKQLLGRIHQHIVSLATEAIVIENGIPCWMKGERQ